MAKPRAAPTKDEVLDPNKPRKYKNEFNTSFLARTAEEALYGGIPLVVAVEVFKIDETTLRAMVERSDIEPCGKHGMANLYTIADLASVVALPRWTEEEWESIFSRRHFPTQLTKEYWAAKKARLDYLLTSSDLWPVEDVSSMVGNIFKSIAMGLKLIPDLLERETTLTERQRNAVVEIADAALESVRKTILETFEPKIPLEKKKRFEDLTGELVLNDEQEDTDGDQTQGDKDHEAEDHEYGEAKEYKGFEQGKNTWLEQDGESADCAYNAANL